MSLAVKNKNLIKVVNEDENHPFHHILKPTADFNGLVLRGKEYQVYGKQTRLETVATAIVDGVLLKEDASSYVLFASEIEGCQSDIKSALTRTNICTNVIEVKICSVTASKQSIHQVIDHAFMQARKYQKDTSDTFFVSVVVVDPEFLINNPKGIDIFYAVALEEKRKDLASKNYLLFKSHGFYVITRKFDKVSDSYASSEWFHLPKHAVARTELKTQIKNLGDVPEIVSSMSDLLKFPTSSSNEGIKNVRDVLPLSNKSKYDLFIDILRTFIMAYKEGDRKRLLNASAVKEFVYIEKETIIQAEQKGLNVTQVCTTMNGALIDGQNSIDCFRILLDFLTNYHNKNKQQDYFKVLAGKIKEMGFIGDYQDLINFLYELEFRVHFRVAATAQEAMESAIAQNNTVSVSVNDLWMSRHSEEVRALTCALLSQGGYVLKSPKSTSYGLPKNNVGQIEFTFFAKAVRMILAMTGKEDMLIEDHAFKLRAQLTSSAARKDMGTLCSEKFLKKTLISEGDSIILKMKVEELKTHLVGIPYCIAQGVSEEKERELHEQFLVVKKDYELAVEELKSTNVYHYKVQQQKFLKNVFETLLILEEALAEAKLILSKDVIGVANQVQKKTLFAFCLIALINKHKRHNLKNTPIKVEKVKEAVNNFLTNFYDQRISFPTTNLTVLSHADVSAVVFDRHGEKHTIKSVIKSLFDV